MTLCIHHFTVCSNYCYVVYRPFNLDTDYFCIISVCCIVACILDLGSTLWARDGHYIDIIVLRAHDNRIMVHVVLLLSYYHIMSGRLT